MKTKLRPYSVYLEGKEIEIVFYALNDEIQTEREAYVKKSLVDHDGYNPEITVTES